MSRYNTSGIHPDTKQKLTNIAYGYDKMIHNPGYFIQVFDNTDADLMIFDAGLLQGLNSLEFIKLIQKWNIKIPKHQLVQISNNQII